MTYVPANSKVIFSTRYCTAGVDKQVRSMSL